MKKGFSFESFGKSPVCVSKQTLYDWMEKHPEFLDARKKGDIESLAWWEEQGMKGLFTPGGKEGVTFNSSTWIFNMKNRHRWRDRIEHSTDNYEGAGFKISYDPKA